MTKVASASTLPGGVVSQSASGSFITHHIKYVHEPHKAKLPKELLNTEICVNFHETKWKIHERAVATPRFVWNPVQSRLFLSACKQQLAVIER